MQILINPKLLAWYECLPCFILLFLQHVKFGIKSVAFIGLTFPYNFKAEIPFYPSI